MSIPGALALTLLYRLIVVHLDLEFAWIRRVFRPASLVVLCLLVIELIGLITIGARRSRALIGFSYEVLRAVVFFLGTPALINVMNFRQGEASKWWVVAASGTVSGFGLVLLQFYVSARLHGAEV